MRSPRRPCLSRHVPAGSRTLDLRRSRPEENFRVERMDDYTSGATNECDAEKHSTHPIIREKALKWKLLKSTSGSGNRVIPDHIHPPVSSRKVFRFWHNSQILSFLDGDESSVLTLVECQPILR
jgi:hypothetical protein